MLKSFALLLFKITGTLCVLLYPITAIAQQTVSKLHQHPAFVSDNTHGLFGYASNKLGGYLGRATHADSLTYRFGNNLLNRSLL